MKRSWVVRPAILLLIALLFGSCSKTAGGPAPVSTPPTAALPKPALVVLITIDQMRPDYYDRFKNQLSGGLARLFEGSAVFLDAHHDHAITETAPGHATLM